MLFIAKSMKELDFRRLMEIYTEGNQENGADRWPEETPDRQLALAEEGFYDYLKNDFFRQEDACYAVWVENGQYVCALRTEPYKDGLLLEALETKPAERRKGYAVKLIQAVQVQLPKNGKLYSHVSKRNAASLKAHEKCGFKKITDCAVYVDGSVNSRAFTLCWTNEKDD